METEKNQLGKGQKEFTMGAGMNRMEDLGTDSPDLKITIMNNGPARKIEFGITDGGRPGRMQELFNGDSITFRLRDYGRGNYLVIANNGHENAKVSFSW